MLFLLTTVACGASEPGARVVKVHNAAASRPAKGRAYFKPQPAEVRRMVDVGIRHWTNQDTSAAGWRTLISPQDIVGIKVNAAPGPVIGTRPSVARAVASALIDAGIPSKNIVIWDKSRDDLHRSGFFQVGRDLNMEVRDSIGAGFERHIYHPIAGLKEPLERGDLEYGKLKISNRSHLTRLVSRRFTRIIQISPLLYHNSAGVDGCLHGLAIGSVDNTRRLHKYKVYLDEAVPKIHRMAANYHLLADVDYGNQLEKAKNSLKGLAPPGVTKEYSFYYESEDSENALPPLRALGKAFADAKGKKHGQVAQVIIESPDKKHICAVKFYPDGRVEHWPPQSKACLHIVDALLCQFSGGDKLRLQYTAVMNELRFSSDPVALDVLSLADIEQNARAARLNLKTLNRDICRYAALLNLGVDNPDLIKVDRFSLPGVFQGNRE
ncbi:MAG: hypothetical protein QF600_06905 [Verrucomicrobiota bacterium]|nr:hypothetical protein [Verrucomicrobiota bacterium]